MKYNINRIALFLLIAALIIPGASAFDYDFVPSDEPGSQLYESPNNTITFRELAATSQYKLVNPLTDEVVNQFITTGQGRAQFDFDFFPMRIDPNDTVSASTLIYDPVEVQSAGPGPFNMTNEGWKLELRHASNDTALGEVYLYYGLNLHAVEDFFDGFGNPNYYTQDGGATLTESGVVSYLEISGSWSDFGGVEFITDMSMDANESARFSLDTQVSNWDIVIYDEGGSELVRCVTNNGFASGDFTLQAINNSHLKLFEGDKTTVDYINAACPGNVIPLGTEVEEWTFAVGDFSGVGSNDFFVESYYIIPGNSYNWFNLTEPYPHLGSNDTSIFYDWGPNASSLVTTLQNAQSPGLEYNFISPNYEWEEFWPVGPLTPQLLLRNTLEGTIRNIWPQYAESIRQLELESPPDNLNYIPPLTESDTPNPNFQFTYNVLPLWPVNEIYWQYREEGTSTWNTNPSWLEKISGPSSCDVSPLTNNRVLSNCFGAILQDSNVRSSNGLVTLSPGTYEWRFRSVAKDATAGASLKNFTSNIRTFTKQAAFVDVTSISPVDNAVFTTTRPEFRFNVYTEQPGTARLKVDGSVIRSWTVNDEGDYTFTHTPPNGLTESVHTWQPEFVGADSTTTSGDQRTFTVNTSLANDVNITLNSPSDNAVLQERETVLNYTVETNGPANVTLYLDRGSGLNAEDSQEVTSAGTYTFTNNQGALSSIEYLWMVAVNKSGVLFQSDTNSFTVTENVTLKAVRPDDGATIDTPPILFTANYSSTAPGNFSLMVDGDARESIIHQTGFDIRTETFEVSNFTTGKHTYRFKFTTEDGTDYQTDTREFEVLGGDIEIDGPAPGLGLIGQYSDMVLGDILGTDTEQSVAFMAILICIMITGGVAVRAGDGITGAVAGLMSYLGFVYIGFIPAWTAWILIIISGFIVAKVWVSRGGD